MSKHVDARESSTGPIQWQRSLVKFCALYLIYRQCPEIDIVHLKTLSKPGTTSLVILLPLSTVLTKTTVQPHQLLL